MKITVKEVKCPHCGCGEVDPATIDLPVMQQRLQIRGFKTHHGDEDGWWSECLLCDRWFSEKEMEEKYGDQTIQVQHLF